MASWKKFLEGKGTKATKPSWIPTEIATRELQYRLGVRSDKGRVRGNNEDSILVLEVVCTFESLPHARILCAVADGVGGSQKGEVASRLTLQAIAESAARWMPKFDDSDLVAHLKSAIETANEVVANHAMDRPESEGMATTIVATLIDGENAHVVHLGDSRAYMIRSEDIIRLTKDHSQIQEMVDSGEISAEEAVNYPRNVITRAIGASHELHIDSMNQPIRAGERILLCTDGLWDLVKDDEIKQVVMKSETPQHACDELVSLANERGGKDNISVIIVRCEGFKTNQE